MSTPHIIIDIGHARGTGARGNDQEEHDRCTKIAAALQRALTAHKLRVSVLDYPELSNSADLTATATAANATEAALGVSLHMDYASMITGYRRVTDEDGETHEEAIYEPNPSPHGAHVCYYSSTGQRIARAIAEHLCTLLPGRAEPCVKRTDLYILRHTTAPWVLCECGFITHAGDAAMQPERIADAISTGILSYLSA